MQSSTDNTKDFVLAFPKDGRTMKVGEKKIILAIDSQ